MTERAKVLLEVCNYASQHRDTRGPDMVMSGRDLDTWRDGYRFAMNKIAQHFNMERLREEGWK